MSDFWDGLFGKSHGGDKDTGRTHTDGKIFYDDHPIQPQPQPNGGDLLPASGPGGVPGKEYFDILEKRAKKEKREKNFNAEDEAEKLIKLAKDRLDTPDTFWQSNTTKEGRAAAKKLGDEWASLNQDERNKVGKELAKYNNWKMDALPCLQIYQDHNGNVTAVKFSASFWDWNRGPSTIALEGQNGAVIEEQISWASYRGFIKETEYTMRDLYEK